MISFIQQLKAADLNLTLKPDLATDGHSAHVHVGGNAVPKDTTRLRVDKSAHRLDGRVDYGRIFSLELPSTILSMDANVSTQGTSCLAPSKAFQAVQAMILSSKPRDVFRSKSMLNLRNVAFPPSLGDKDLPTFDTSSTDLGRVLPARRNPEYLYRMACNGYALRDRFDGLPVHRVCYYHSHHSCDVAIRDLGGALAQSTMQQRGRDVIGMTPLHILACSTKHHVDMYKMVIASNPEQLVTEDAWGGIPLMYLLWGRAPWDIVEIFASSIKEYHGTAIEIDWEKMIATFCRGMAPMACIEYLIEVADRTFDDRGKFTNFNWNHFVRLLCTDAKAPEKHIRQFIELYDSACPQNDSDLEMLSLELAREVKFGFQSFWLRLGIYQRLVLLDREEWRAKIASLIKSCPTGSSGRHKQTRVALMDSILQKLAYYELTARLWVLELALWKAKIEGFENASDGCRQSCQITSGADVIVPNIMEYFESWAIPPFPVRRGPCKPSD